MKNVIYSVIGKFAKFNSWLLTLSGAVLFVMNCVVFYAVIMRYVLRMPPVWTTETATFMLLFITFITAGIVHQNDGHIKVDFIINRFGGKTTLKWVNIFNALIGSAYFILLSWQSSRLVIKAFKGEWLSSDMAIPLGYPLLLLPIGCALLGISSLFRGIDELSCPERTEGGIDL